MPYDRPEPLVPYFGVGPFNPPPVTKTGEAKRCGLCRSKDGLSPSGSTLVCMRCHSVAPEIDARLAGKRTEAVRTRELDRREVQNQSIALRLSRKASAARDSPILTPAERRQLLADNPHLEWVVRGFLDSIGQPVNDDGPEDKPEKSKPAWKRKLERAR
jgi:hypothetical protein